MAPFHPKTLHSPIHYFTSQKKKPQFHPFVHCGISEGGREVSEVREEERKNREVKGEVLHFDLI